MTGYVADLSWKSGARAIEKLDRLRSTMAVNVLIVLCCLSLFVVLFMLFATSLLTQHFNKQGFNNYCIVFINDLCSLIKHFI